MSRPLPEGVHARLAARARRISVIRRRVLAATLATFALAWGVIASTGSMGASSAASTQTASTQGTTSSRGTSSSSSDDSSSSTGRSSAPGTTAQS
jgi:hypothetical protein